MKMTSLVEVLKVLVQGLKLIISLTPRTERR